MGSSAQPGPRHTLTNWLALLALLAVGVVWGNAAAPAGEPRRAPAAAHAAPPSALQKALWPVSSRPMVSW